MTKEELTQTRKAIFDKAAKDRKAAKAEEEANKGRNRNNANYTALEMGVPKIVRFLGLPVSSRGILGDDPTSPKLINYSQILGDDAKKFRCIWPIKSENPNWILWKIYNKVMSGKWNAESQSKIFDYREKFPGLWQRVAKNDNINNAYEEGWKPKAYVIANVIDRSMMQWHQENKKTVLLSKKVSDNNGTPWYEPGIPNTLYNSLYELIVPVYGDWETYDMALVKLDDKPFYNSYEVPHHQMDLAGLYPTQWAAYDISYADRPLTDEELSWKRENIDVITQITTYQKINTRLGIFIKAVDAAFKTKFYDELQDLVEKEKIEIAESKAKNSDSDDEQEEAKPTPVPISKTQAKPVETLAPVPASPPVRKSATPAPAPVQDYFSKLIAAGYVGIEKCTDVEKAFIIGFDEAKQKPIWKNGVQLFQCAKPNCRELGPEEIHVCVKCGVEYE